MIREFLAKYAKNPAAVKSSLGLGMSGVSMSDQPSKSGTYVNLDHTWTGDLLSTSGEQSRYVILTVYMYIIVYVIYRQHID